MARAQEHLRIPVTNGSRRIPEPDWRPLYRIGGVTALAAAVLTPVALAVFVVWPPPYGESAAKWFELLLDNRILGLLSLDLLLVVINLLMVPVILGLYVALRRANPVAMLLWVATFFVGLAAFCATNPSIEMLSLSNRYAEVTTETQRIALLGAGETLLAGATGTAFHVSYILAQLAGIAIGIVILRADVFSHKVGWLMIVGNAVGFGLYLPVVGLGLSALGGAILWVWLIVLTRGFFKLAQVGFPLPSASIQGGH